MLKLFRNLEKKDFFIIFFVITLVIFSVYLDLKLPEYMSEITMLVQTSTSTMKEILTAGGYMMLCAIGSFLCVVITGFFTSLLSARFSRSIRKKVFEKVEDFGFNEIKKFKTSSLITRTTNDVTQIEMLLAMGLQFIVKSPIMAIWALMKIIGKSNELSRITGIGVIIIVITNLYIIKKVSPRFEKMQKLTDKMNDVTRENITGIRVIRAFNAEKYQEKRFEEVNEDLTSTQLSNFKTFAIMDPIMTSVMHFQSLGIYFVGAYLIMNAGMMEKMTLFSNMVVFSSYGLQVIMSFLMLTMIFMILPRAQVSANRIGEVLEEEITVTSGTFQGKTNEKGTIRFEHVSFKYPDADEYVLQDISFEVKQGETVAFIGSTGSGKSTLINLIPRFYDVTEGNIYVDGVDVKEYDLSTLHNKIGYVPQRAVMFTGSIQENVSYGDNGKKKPTKEEMRKAIEVAQAKEFVEKTEDQLDSHIARGGTNISGGQKQRLAIARAIARDPEIYIFDDSFSALDYQTDAKLRQELKKHTKEATNVIVAQRIGTILQADKIIVLEKGTCVGQGTHQELFKDCEIYREIALSQLSEEELKHA